MASVPNASAHTPASGDSTSTSSWIWSPEELERFALEGDAVVRSWAVKRLRDLAPEVLVRLAPRLLPHLVSSQSHALEYSQVIAALEATSEPIPVEALGELLDSGQLRLPLQVRVQVLLAGAGAVDELTELADLDDLPGRGLDAWVSRDPDGLHRLLRSCLQDGGPGALAGHFPWWLRVAAPRDLPLVLQELRRPEPESEEDVEELMVRASCILERVGAHDLLESPVGLQIHEAMEETLSAWARRAGARLILPTEVDLEDLQAAVDAERWSDAADLLVARARDTLRGAHEPLARDWADALLDTLEAREQAEPIDVALLLALWQGLLRFDLFLEDLPGVPLDALLELWATGSQPMRARLEPTIVERWAARTANEAEERARSEQVIVANVVCTFSQEELDLWSALVERLPGLELPVVSDATGGLPSASVLELLVHDPDRLERIAREHLGVDEVFAEPLLLVLGSLPCCWASELIVERLKPLLTMAPAVEVWSALQALGDPGALDVALAEWRPLERSVGECAIVLAAVGGRSGELPPGLLEEEGERRRGLGELLETLTKRGGLGDALAPADDEPFYLELQCTECGRTHTYEAPSVTVAPSAFDSDSRSEDWDGIVLNRIITCKSCGAVDRYAPTLQARIWIVAELAAVTEDPARLGKKLLLGEPRLFDGTLMTRASDGVRHLQDLVEANPDGGEPRRRLGNLYERLGLLEEAKEAWREAIAVDESEAEAAYSLVAQLWEEGDYAQALDAIITCLRRLPEAPLSAEGRREIALEVVWRLEELTPHVHPPLGLMLCWPGERQGDHQIVNMSSVDLARIRDWERLAEMFAAGTPISVQFTHELQEEPTHLEALLGATRGRAGGLAALGPPSRPSARPSAGSAQQRRKKAKAARAQRKANRKKGKKKKGKKKR